MSRELRRNVRARLTASALGRGYCCQLFRESCDLAAAALSITARDSGVARGIVRAVVYRIQDGKTVSDLQSER